MYCKRPLTNLALFTLCLLIISLAAAPAQAQIPGAAVDAALNGSNTTMMLTATSAHTYRHRTRIEPISVSRSGGALIATGKLVNVIKWDTDGVMHYQITCRKGMAPEIQILSVKEPKSWGRTIKKVGNFANKVLPVVVAAFANSEGSGQASQGGSQANAAFDLQTVADGVGAGDEVRQLEQKDWKTPAVALIAAIAARLQASL